MAGFGSAGGGAESTGGGGATRDDGVATAIIEIEEEDSAFVDLLFFLWGSACADETASSATNETMPMDFADIKKWTLLCVRPSGEPLFEKSERDARTGTGGGSIWYSSHRVRVLSAPHGAKQNARVTSRVCSGAPAYCSSLPRLVVAMTT
jgi:hypothetical protein